MVKIFIVVYLLLNIRDVVQNRCNATGIPPEVQPACRIIGKGLIQQYECSHETGELTDPKKMTCCR